MKTYIGKLVKLDYTYLNVMMPFYGNIFALDSRTY